MNNVTLSDVMVGFVTSLNKVEPIDLLKRDG